MPNRMMRESLLVSEQVAGLSWFEEVCFTRLILCADDYGRSDGRAAVLAARMFPLKRQIPDEEVAGAIDALCAAGLVARYEANGQPWLALTGWERHQKLRYRRAVAPPPPAELGLPGCGESCVCADAQGRAYTGAHTRPARFAYEAEDKTREKGDTHTAWPAPVLGDTARWFEGSEGFRLAESLRVAESGDAGAQDWTRLVDGTGAVAQHGGAGTSHGGASVQHGGASASHIGAGTSHGGASSLCVGTAFPRGGASGSPGGAAGAVVDFPCRFTPPGVDEVAAYIQAQGFAVDPKRFVDFYESKGWLVGSSPMRSWRAAVNLWQGNLQAEALAAARVNGEKSRARLAASGGGATKKGRAALGGGGTSAPGAADAKNPFTEASL